MPERSGTQGEGNAASTVGDGYARYVLCVLIIVYVFNFIDRQIISILAEEIKADLGISDAQIGFLYGTAFAIFYAIFGIPLNAHHQHFNGQRNVFGLAVAQKGSGVFKILHTFRC